MGNVETQYDGKKERNPMANNYVEFSQWLPVENEEQKAWLEEFLKSPPDDHNEYLKWCKNRNVDPDADVHRWWPGLRILEKNAPNPWGLWVRADDVAAVDFVAHMVQTFFARFEINRFFKLTWAETCSKLRVGEFSGGGFLVFPFGKEVKWFIPNELMDNEIQRYEDQKKNKA